MNILKLSCRLKSVRRYIHTHCTIWWIDEISRTLSETNELHRIENVISNSNSNRCQGILWQSFDTKFHQTEIFELACFWKNLLYTFIVSKKKALILVHLVYQVAEILEKCQYKERENLTTSSNLWRQVLFPNSVSCFVCVCEMRILGNADIALICSVKKAIVLCVRNEHKTEILRLFQLNFVPSCDKESFELRFVNKCVCESKQKQKLEEKQNRPYFLRWPRIENISA